MTLPPRLRRLLRSLLGPLTVLVLVALAYKVNALPVYADLDSSYRFAFNYFFVTGLLTEQPIIFSYGPLGFLMFPQAVGRNLEIGITAQLLLSVVLVGAALEMAACAKRQAPLAERVAGVVAVVLLANFLGSGLINYTGFGVSLVVVQTLFLLLHRETGHPGYLLAALLACALALLVKSTYGILSILLLLSYAGLHGLEHRRPHVAAVALVGIPLVFLASWVALYRSLEGIPAYLRGTLELADGFGSAMALSTRPGIDWWLVLGSLGLAAILPRYLQSDRVSFLYAMFLLPLAASFKYAFARADVDHMWTFVEMVTCFFLLILIAAPRTKRLLLPVMATSVVLLIVNIRLVGAGIAEHREFFDRLFLPRAWHQGYFNYSIATGGFADYRADLVWQSGEFTKENRLPADFRNLIGSHTVDTYPWETSYIYANGLHWLPRPVFQSYLAYTPWLDRQNAAHFASDRGPDFILWEREHWGGELGSIDDRYLLNDEPMTILTLMRHYRIVALHPRVAVLRRAGRPLIGPEHSLGTEHARWNEWINVPPSADGILRAKISIGRQVLGRLKRLFYREDEVFIEYGLTDGRGLKYRLVPDQMGSGVWVNPLLTTLSPRYLGDRVVRIRLTHSPADFFEPDLRIEWVLYPFDRTSD